MGRSLNVYQNYRNKINRSVLEKDIGMISRAEQLNESRKTIEEASAIQTLNFIWGLKLFVNIAVGVFVAWLAIFASGPEDTPWEYVTLIWLFLLVESVFIVGYFKRRPWCLVPLHIFAGLSLINFPVGTVLAIIHFVNARKLCF